MTSNPQRAYHPLQLQYPSQAQIDECRIRTAELLGLTTTGKKQSALQQKLDTNLSTSGPQHITHKSAYSNTERIIQIHDETIDPLQPSRFKLKKTTVRPPSPPTVSLMDSSLSKTSQEELAKWKIPPSVSNWTNTRKHIIDVGVRAIVDKNTTSEITISDKHFDLTQALDDTMKRNREGVAARQELQQLSETAARERERMKLEQHAHNVVLGTSSHLLQTNNNNTRNNNMNTMLTPDDFQPTTRTRQHGDDGDDETNININNTNNDDDDDLTNTILAAQNQQRREQEQRNILEREEEQRQQAIMRRKQRDIGEVQINSSNVPNQQSGLPTGMAYNQDSAIGIGSGGMVDDHVLNRVAQGESKFINDEDPYDGDLFDTSKSRSAYNNKNNFITDEDGNIASSKLGQGALTRDAPVLFQKGTTIAATNATNGNNNSSNNSASFGNGRDRDRDYQ